jgi:hypothetical protein
MAMIELLRQFGVGFVALVREFQSGIFALFGIALGAWLSRRAELMRLRVERRTQIFDDASSLTARYYLAMAKSESSVGLLYEEPGDDFFVSVMCLDRNIEAHFSNSAYATWRQAEAMIAHSPRTSLLSSALLDSRC